MSDRDDDLRCPEPLEPTTWTGSDLRPWPSVEQGRAQERRYLRDVAAAQFEQDLRRAVRVLGWARVHAVIDQVQRVKDWS